MYHLIAAVFISGKRLVDSYMGTSASSYGSDVPIKLSSQGSMRSFPRRCQERGILKGRKRCDQFYDHLVFKLKDFSYNTLYLHIFSYFHGTKQWKDRKEDKG